MGISLNCLKLLISGRKLSNLLKETLKNNFFFLVYNDITFLKCMKYNASSYLINLMYEKKNSISKYCSLIHLQ